MATFADATVTARVRFASPGIQTAQGRDIWGIRRSIISVVAMRRSCVAVEYSLGSLKRAVAVHFGFEIALGRGAGSTGEGVQFRGRLRQHRGTFSGRVRVGERYGSRSVQGGNPGQRQDSFRVLKGRRKSVERVAAGHSRARRASAFGTMATFADATVTARVRFASPGGIESDKKDMSGPGVWMTGWTAERHGQRCLRGQDFEVLGTHGGSETQKYRFYKGLGGGKGLRITHIGIVNARESETHRMPRLTGRGAIVPWQNRWKGHHDARVTVIVDRARSDHQRAGVRDRNRR